ncbi:MAG: TonB-dependent siderophore receptor [Timaviella obliquedivisa GSE-PSE-MK23-08B]|jgi:iron complex outermembrane receptor protein|nr:TonB-dependent siderophore receptor [Timaviella obliquedivisa GSE-PSE-MK23-08B]
MNQVQWLKYGVLFGVIGAAIAISEPTRAETGSADMPLLHGLNADGLKANEPNATATTVEKWLAQEESYLAQSLIQVIGVRVKDTESGLEVVLETAEGDLTAPATSVMGNALIADIPNAVLVLPNGEEFQQANPAEGIALISVTSRESGIRVAITGLDAPPTTEVRTEAQGLVLSVVASAEGRAGSEEDAIQVVVTGEQDEGYAVPNASTATRTDTPLRDIPQSIQIIPRQVIEDQGATRVEDVLRNAVGVASAADTRAASSSFLIRGFDSSTTLRNGFRIPSGGDGTSARVQTPSNLERIEILRGPASVLYGTGEPGGIINFVTKQPLREPYYSAELTAGSYSFYEGSIDLSGPLTEDERLLYRFNASYENFGSFADFVNGELISIAPILRYEFSDATALSFSYDYTHIDQASYSGLPIDPIAFELPRSRNYNEPDGDRLDSTDHSLILSFEHEFSDSLRLNSAISAVFSEGQNDGFGLFGFDPQTNLWERYSRLGETYSSSYTWQTDLMTRFNTGSIQHQLLFGLELRTSSGKTSVFESTENSAINVLYPIYGTPFSARDDYTFINPNSSDTVGVYLQDQITLLPNLKLLLGGRYDSINQNVEINSIFEGVRTDNSNDFYNEAFSPRAGIVYQPIEPISLYGSFSQSFVPNNTTTREGDLIEPTRGTQYEIGVRAEFGDLAANLAVYEITKTNILTNDPDDPNFSVPVGAVRSRGIEFDIGGEILTGWNLFASAFLNDAIVTKDSTLPEGDRLQIAPDQGASLWTTYELQSGNLQGLGFGIGVFYVGDREAELPNDFVIPSYVRADASLFYRRDNWRVALNFKNLTSTRYYEDAQYGLFVGAPFTVLGTVSVQF